MKDDAELAQWLADYCNGVISAEDFAALEQQLHSSAEARAHFRSYLHLDAELRQRAERDPVMEQAWAPVERVQPTAEKVIRPMWGQAKPWLAFAAAVVLLAVLGWRFLPRAMPVGEVVATVSASSGAEWLADGRSMATVAGSEVRAGSYELRAGLLEISCTNGAVLLIESPATFELRTPSAVTLRDGTLCARVPESAVGFTVDTPGASVVDLGTEFGVSATAEASEVHVFKGEVLLKSASVTDPRHLTEAHASRIDAATGTPAGITYEPDKFFRTLSEPSELYSVVLRRLQPVAYYRMRPTTEGTVLKDVTRGAHDGTVAMGHSRKAWAPGKFGSALKLNGAAAGAHAVIPKFPKATDASLSVCAWVLAESRPRWASIAKNWAGDEGASGTGQFHFGLWHDEGSLAVQAHDAAGREVAVRENQPLPLDEWQFVAFTHNGVTLRLYRNGEEVAATPCAGLSTAGPSALGIGAKLDATGAPDRVAPGFWSGRLDEMAVFHSALTSAQIRKLYETARTPPTK